MVGRRAAYVTRICPRAWLWTKQDEMRCVAMEHHVACGGLIERVSWTGLCQCLVIPAKPCRVLERSGLRKMGGLWEDSSLEHGACGNDGE